MPGKPVSIEDAVYALWGAGADMATLDELLERIAHADYTEDIIRRKVDGWLQEAKRPSRKGKG